MREYTPENITDVVIEQMSTDARPAHEGGHGGGGASPARLRARGEADPGRVDQRHRVHDQGRPDVHAGAAGVHPAVRYRGSLRPRQHHARQDQDGGGDRRQPARALLPREHAQARAGRADRPHRQGRARRSCCSAASPTPRASRYPVPRSPSGRPRRTAATTSRTASRRSTAAASSAPTTRATTSSARCGRSATSSRSTARSAQMVMAQKRHGKRPAHIHFLIGAPGYRELVTALYLAGDEHLEDDVVFGASGDLVVEVKNNDPACADQGPAQHPLRLQPGARERGRPAGRPRRRRSGRRYAIGQRQAHRPLRRPAAGDAGRRAAEEGRHPGRPVPQVEGGTFPEFEPRPTAAGEDPRSPARMHKRRA